MEKQTTTNTFNATDSSFDQDVLQSEVPVLVDFWADWCGPCKALDPTVRSLADDYQGMLRVAKLNVDDNPETATRYGIRGIPTLVMFKDGDVQKTFIGVKPKAELARMIDRYLQ